MIKVKAIENRRSVRKFKKGEMLSREQIEELLTAAMLAPSACNTRPWEFIVITNREVLNEIAKIHPYAKMCTSASAAIIITANPQSGMPEGYYPQDCAAAAQNILLEAVEMGFGACWCGVFPKEDLMAEIRNIAGISVEKNPFNIIAIGIPDETPKQRGFFDAEKVRFIE